MAEMSIQQRARECAETLLTGQPRGENDIPLRHRHYFEQTIASTLTSALAEKDAEITALRNEREELKAAVRPLLRACEDEFLCDGFSDSEPVGLGDDGPSQLTFGMIRQAIAALAAQQEKP